MNEWINEEKISCALWTQTTAAVAPTAPERTKWSWITSAGTTSAAAHRVLCVYKCVRASVRACQVFVCESCLLQLCFPF